MGNEERLGLTLTTMKNGPWQPFQPSAPRQARYDASLRSMGRSIDRQQDAPPYLFLHLHHLITRMPARSVTPFVVVSS